MSINMLQSRNALPRDLKQLVFIDGDMIDNNLKVALLQLPLAAALLGVHHGLLSYGVRLESSNQAHRPKLI